jgi:hypothetical protein
MIPGISTGGGGLSADWGATANNAGGTNSLGGFSFGDYNPPSVPVFGVSSGGSSGLMTAAVVVGVGLLVYMVIKK